MRSQKLINAYNATSTIDELTGDIETVEVWLERQLLNRINEIERLEIDRNINYAAQQLTGFAFGETMKLSEIVILMGLTKKEWNTIKANFHIQQLTEDHIKEIEDTLKL